MRAEYQTADGVTHGTVYLAAPGVTADQLYQKLKGHGVRGVQAPSKQASSTTVTPMDVSCDYGTATALNGCPPIIWTLNGNARPQVYYYDHTGAGWPESTVVNEWNQTYKLDTYWTTGGCPGGSTHCIDVWEDYYGQNGWQGLTTYSWDSSRHFIDGSVYIQYNDSYSSNHQAVACQESGHAVGMGHNSNTDSCMYPYSPSSGGPDSDDYYELSNGVY